jgi:hypothetical protein
MDCLPALPGLSANGDIAEYTGQCSDYDDLARTPAGPTNALRLALGRPTQGEPGADAGGCGDELTRPQMRYALHYMPQAAGSLRAPGPKREEFEREARTPARAANSYVA